VAVTPRHGPANLQDVSEVVSCPGGQELADGDRTEVRVRSLECELLRLQVQRAHALKIIAA